MIVMKHLQLFLRKMPILLPHELIPWLVQHNVFPFDGEADAEFWEHLLKVGTPTHGATPAHVSLYIWGDDAEFTEHHQDKLVVVSMGRVLETRRHALRYCWPLFNYVTVSGLSNGCM